MNNLLNLIQPLSPEIKRNNQLTLAHPQCKPSLCETTKSPPLLSFQRAPTVRDHLVYTFQTAKHNQTWLYLTGNFWCGRCCHCNNTTNSKFFSHPHTRKKFPIYNSYCKLQHNISHLDAYMPLWEQREHSDNAFHNTKQPSAPETWNTPFCTSQDLSM